MTTQKMVITGIIAVVLFVLCANILWMEYTNSASLKPRSIHVELQTEEPLSPGDSLQVLNITKGKDQDTIWIGYLH